MINIGIHGGSGKMGTMIYECLKDSNEAKVSAIWTFEELSYTPNFVVT